jgi:hypothetical protein
MKWLCCDTGSTKGTGGHELEEWNYYQLAWAWGIHIAWLASN